MRRTFLPLSFLLLFLFLAVANTAYAQKSFFWESFDVDLRLREDGSMDVTEQQTLVFDGGSFTFGFATIPYNRLDDIRDISVREGDRVYERAAVGGTPYTYTAEDLGNELEIRWYFPATEGRHSYTFGYTVDGVVRVAEDGNQVFWMAVPSDVPGPVNSSRVTLTVPEGVTILSTLAQVDGLEKGADASISEDMRRATFETQNIGNGRTFEAGVRFPTEQLALTAPAWQQQEDLNDTFGLLLLVASVLVTIGGPILVLGAWYTRGRDPEVVFSAEYITSPPDNTPPGLVGSLIDEKADMRDILSTLVDLARRGFIHIKEEKSDHTYTLTNSDTSELRGYEKYLISALFAGSETKKLSELRYKFADKLPKLRKTLYSELVTQQYFHKSPDGVRQGWRALGFVSLALGFVLMFLLAGALDGIPASLCLGMAILPGSLLLIYTATHMPRKTQLGAEAAAKWEAFRTYLRNIEKYDDMAEASEIFDKYLPYAVAFGFERGWIRKFERIPTVTPPVWYAPYPRRHYGRGLGWGGFGRSSTSSTPTPAPRGAPGEGGGIPSLDGMSESMTGGLEGMSKGLTDMLNATSRTMKSVEPPKNTGGGGGGGFSGGFSGGSSGGGSRGFG